MRHWDGAWHNTNSSMEGTAIARQLKSGDRFFRGKTVRLLSENNEQLGLMSYEAALDKAAAAGLDLVEVAGKAEPPVVRIMDYGKYLYQESRRQREAKKNQVQQKVKEVKIHPSTDTNDLATKARQAIEFLKKGDKVKVIMFFRGREMAHQEIGEQLLQTMLDKLSEVSVLEGPPKLIGRQIIASVAPKPAGPAPKQPKAPRPAAKGEDDASAKE